MHKIIQVLYLLDSILIVWPNNDGILFKIVEKSPNTCSLFWFSVYIVHNLDVCFYYFFILLSRFNKILSCFDINK